MEIRASISLYALAFLLAFVLSSGLIFRYIGTQSDAASNLYGQVQNELIAKLAYDIAFECVVKMGASSCKEDSFMINNTEASYTTQAHQDSLIVRITVLHTNPRNHHMLRYSTQRFIRYAN